MLGGEGNYAREGCPHVSAVVIGDVGIHLLRVRKLIFLSVLVFTCENSRRHECENEDVLLLLFQIILVARSK